MKKERFNIVPEKDAINNAFANRNSQQIFKFLELSDNVLGKAKERKDKKSKVLVTIEKCTNGFIHISYEDNVGGVKKISGCILKMKAQQSESFENQYSIGSKESLIGLTIDGGMWTIFSRTADMINQHQYNCVKGPYDFEGDEYVVYEEDKQWPGEFKEAGTIVDMTISEDVVASCIYDLKKRQGITKRRNIFKKIISDKMNLDEFVIYLGECLGFYYAKAIRDNVIEFIIRYKNEDKLISPIDEVRWGDSHEKWSGTRNLGRGNVNIELEYGLIKPSDNRLFYTCNRENCGLEITINGRRYMCGGWIWEQQKESHHSTFLCQVNITSIDKRALPKPNMDKSGFSETDECFLELLQYIKGYIPKPYRDDMNKKLIEEAKKLKLIQVLENMYANAIQIIAEYEVGREYNVIGNKSVDLRTCMDGDVSFYELKKGALKKDILGQILGYIVLALSENEKIDKFIIVSEAYSIDLAQDLRHIGEVFGIEVICRKWKDYNIQTEEIIKIVERK